MAQSTQAFVGTIKTFNMQKGWGHIECEQTHQLYGKDIFLLRSQVNGVVPCKGDQVYFDVTEGTKGTEATNVQIVSNASLNGQGAYVGTLKSWNPVKGWGHIECEMTNTIYGKDVFFMRSAIPGGDCSIGDEVSFSVEEGEKGVQATGVTIIASKARQSLGGHMPGPWGMQSQGYVGSIKSFDEVKGWGHIDCDATRQLYGKDMFVLRSALNGQTVTTGQQVRFSVAMGQKGPEAHNVNIVNQRGSGQVIRPPQQPWAPPGGQYGGYQVTVPFHTPQQALAGSLNQGYSAPQGYGAQSGTRFSGTVKNWNPEKGWGFVACEDTMNIYGKDIFLHKKELGAQLPLAGSAVQFGVAIGADGRPIATGVSLNGGYGAAHAPIAAGGKGWAPY